MPAERPAARPSRAARRTDPDRRDRIVDAALEVLAEHGVAGASHRRIAERAGVPLGSMTYHFAGMDDLLRVAFTRLADRVADRFERRMAAVASADQVVDAVVDMVLQDTPGSGAELVLSHELYTLAARREEFRDITHAWMARSRAALERHLDRVTARQLDALVEGLVIHRALDLGRDPRDERGFVRDAVARVLAGAAPSR